MATFVRETYDSELTKNDLLKADTIPVTAGEIVRLGEYVVQAGEVLIPGMGMLSGADSANGRLFIDLKDTNATPANVEGMLRLHIYSPKDRPMAGGIVKEIRTGRARMGATDVNQRIAFPSTNKIIREDRKLALEFIPDADATISKANSEIAIDVIMGVPND